MKLTAFRPGSAAALLVEEGESKILLDCVPLLAAKLIEREHDPLGIDFILMTYGGDNVAAEVLAFLGALKDTAAEKFSGPPPRARSLIGPPRMIAKVKAALPEACAQDGWLALVPIEGESISFGVGKELHIMCFRVSLGYCGHCSAPSDFLYAYKIKPAQGRGFIYAGTRWPRKNGNGSAFADKAVKLFKGYGETAPCLICDGIAQSTQAVLALMPDKSGEECQLVLLPRSHGQYNNPRRKTRFAEATQAEVILAQHGVPFEL